MPWRVNLDISATSWRDRNDAKRLIRRVKYLDRLALVAPQN
jgi:hypothetical protein